MSVPSCRRREEGRAPTARRARGDQLDAARVGLGRFDGVTAHERTDAVPPAASPTTPTAFPPSAGSGGGDTFVVRLLSPWPPDGDGRGNQKTTFG